MKKVILILLIGLLIPIFADSQVIYSPKVDSVINLISIPLMTKYVRELSGDTIAMVGGQPVTIVSRYWSTQGNILASQYIYEKFQSFGLQTRYQINNATNVNVIARKTGSVYPNLKFVIGAHYDDMPPGPVAPGADDNASGVAAVLEAARLLANYNLKYTVEFVVFDEEEIGLLGAVGYADSCLAGTDTLIGVLNMDMIAWDGNNDGLIRIMTHQFCDILADMLISSFQRYNINLTPVKAYGAGGSDHVAFWQRGFYAISSIEPANDFHPFYHTIWDTVGLFNMEFFLKNAKSNLATLMCLSEELYYYIFHYPVTSTSDTTQRNIYTEIIYGIPLASGINAPRLYYKIGNNPYQWINASQINGTEYQFIIPGQPHGTQISYYVAAQDTGGIYLATSPTGGSGVNPPGTTPPPEVYTYYVLSSMTHTSNNQVPIPDNQLTRDTIYIQQTGIVQEVKLNLNINHTNDGDILIALQKGSTVVNVSQFNGNGGQNYTNTTFHDTASVPITQGVPPFTGYFRPQVLLNALNGAQLQGNWILRVFDNRAGNTGTLLNWTLDIIYSSPVSVKKEENLIADKYLLYQNYPNPFNPSTVIKYSLPKNSQVVLKIFDILGKEVTTLVNQWQTEGVYTAEWNAASMPTGVYFYRLSVDGFSDTKRMILIR